MSQNNNLYQATNENAVAGFETVETTSGAQIVIRAAPIIRRLVIGHKLHDAVKILTNRGWQVERLTDD